MISHEEIKELVVEWNLREVVIEKDYVLGWILWGIGSEPELSNAWIFKGGTCLKKCFLETYRFSEDIDFTIIPEGLITPEEVSPIIRKVIARVHSESGIDFSVSEPRFTSRDNPLSTEGRIYYRGPCQARTPVSIKLDLTKNETIVQPTVLRKISHLYSDKIPEPTTIRTYAFEEIFAEKIRAMGERCRPRDLYDIINLFRRKDFRQHANVILEVLKAKCEFKGIEVPTYSSLDNSPFKAELESEWKNMLAHQLPALPELKPFWDELAALFDWLVGKIIPAELAPMEIGKDEDVEWMPPPTIATWGIGIPLESVRFAAVNHLCVELGYNGSLRVIEPYSLRRTRDGNMVLHAIRTDNREHRSYRVERIQSVRVTNRPFNPIYAIEFSSIGPIAAGLTPHRVSTERVVHTARARKSHGPVYIIECSWCHKKFRRTTRDFDLRPHKDKNGWNCSGRRGFLVDTEWK